MHFLADLVAPLNAHQRKLGCVRLSVSSDGRRHSLAPAEYVFVKCRH
jgi:hypothetical protein